MEEFTYTKNYGAGGLIECDFYRVELHHAHIKVTVLIIVDHNYPVV